MVELFESIAENCKDSSRRSKARGVLSDMSRFNYFFGSMLGQKVLTLTDILSKALQEPSLSASQAQEMARNTLNKLARDRNDFQEFWNEIKDMLQNNDIEVPQESRKRKRKEFHGERGGAEFHPQNLEEKSRITYYTVYDHVIGQIQERFDQPDYGVYAAMESILIDGMMGKPIDCHLTKEIKGACKTRCDCKALTVKELYEKEIDIRSLKAELSVLDYLTNPQQFKPTEFSHCLETLQAIPIEDQTHTNIRKLIKLVMLAPASNANSERVFSSLRRVKTYLRSTMTQTRLENLMTLAIHKEILDEIDLIQAANTFVKPDSGVGSVRRLVNFGEFTIADRK